MKVQMKKRKKVGHMKVQEKKRKGSHVHKRVKIERERERIMQNGVTATQW
jgi:hypothetical protein